MDSQPASGGDIVMQVTGDLTVVFDCTLVALVEELLRPIVLANYNYHQPYSIPFARTFVLKPVSDKPGSYIIYTDIYKEIHE